MRHSQVDLVEKLRSRTKEHTGSIVIIGDAMRDVWVHGVETVAVQEGCQKFVEEHRIETPGGAANAEQCLRHWGVPTLLYGQNDPYLAVKTRFLSGGRFVFRLDNDRVSTDGDIFRFSRARDSALAACSRACAVLLSDYDKGFLTPELIQKVSEECLRRKIPCVADCKRAPEVYPGCILKGNSVYFSEYAVQARRRDSKAVTTYGSTSPLVWDRGECFVGGRISKVQCVNHVGAGDCFAAHLVLALGYGFSLKEAVVLAHSAGRVYVQHAHNRAPLPEEIARDLSIES